MKNRIKICSWNYNVHNKKLDEAEKFIKSLDCDMICLQEVSEEFLNSLKQKFSDLIYAIDHTRVDGGMLEDCYLVIISKHPIVGSGSFMVSEFMHQLIRTKIFVKLMRIFGWVDKVLNHHALFADVEIFDNKERVRIFSTHLRQEGAHERISELSMVSQNFSKNHPNIICGDFNTLYKPWLNIVNWLMGSSFKEAFPWHSEQILTDRFFEELGLKSPLRNKVTHNTVKSQLDHIVVPKDWNVLEAKVVKNSHGSDHYPIFVEVDI